MLMHTKGMVQVSGATYRIVQVGTLHQVFRLLDDRFVGSFRYAHEVSILECHIGPELLVAVAREALRSSLLAWHPRPASKRFAWIVGMGQYLRAGLLWLRATKPELSRRLA